MRTANLRLALRDLRRRPTFAATAIATLAIAIGATTAAFAMVDAVFLTRLPVRDQERLVTLSTLKPDISQFPRWPVPWDLRSMLLQRGNVFTKIAIYKFDEPVQMAARDGARTVQLGRTMVSGNFFDVLGVRPAAGRLFDSTDDHEGAANVVVLSDRAWRSQFEADPHVVDRLILFEGIWHRIIGVAPPEFSYPAGTDAWVPLISYFYSEAGPVDTDGLGCYFVARLRPGATPEAARTALTAALETYAPSEHLKQEWGDLPKVGAVARYTDEVLGREVRPAVLTLFAAVVLVLVIACTNVAGLLLARSLTRLRELAVRTALGAKRIQLVTYLLSECALLALTGGVLGLGIAAGLIRAAVRLAPPDLPMIAAARLNAGVLAFTCAVIIVSLVGFGLWPALYGSRGDPAELLRGGGREVGGGKASGMIRRVLVTAQVALAVVVLSSAGLLTHTLTWLKAVPLGFDPSHLGFFRMSVVATRPGAHLDSAQLERWRAFPDRFAEQLREHAGLNALTVTIRLPLSGSPQEGVASVALDSRANEANPWQQVYYDDVLDDYFGVMGIPLVRGRSLTRQDDENGQRVMVVNQSFARAAWPGQDPIGHRLRFKDQINTGADDITKDPWYTVVGEVRDVRYDDLVEPGPPMVYTSVRQVPHEGWFVVRTQGSPSRAAAAVDHVMRAVEPDAAVSEFTSGPEVVRARLARPRALAVLFAALAGTALFLAAIGLFGVLTGYVRERRRELAVRSALGATPSQLRSLVVAQALGMASVGVACGLPLALGSYWILRAAASDVQPGNASMLAAIAVVVLAVVAAAAYAPTVRATRVDARTALATE